MDHKTALRIEMIASCGLYSLFLDQWNEDNREIDRWDEAHGFGWDDEYTTEEYEASHKCEEFQVLWLRYCHDGEAWKSALDDFCRQMVEFTDGQIGYELARQMVTSPRTKDRLRAIVMEGKAA